MRNGWALCHSVAATRVCDRTDLCSRGKQHYTSMQCWTRRDPPRPPGAPSGQSPSTRTPGLLCSAVLRRAILPGVTAIAGQQQQGEQTCCKQYAQHACSRPACSRGVAMTTSLRQHNQCSVLFYCSVCLLQQHTQPYAPSCIQDGR
jgi:hypothetical protein